jgi:hypothetical protein
MPEGGGRRKEKGIDPERTLVMEIATAIPVPRLIDVEGLNGLYQVLVAEGYHVIGPAVEDGAIVLRGTVLGGGTALRMGRPARAGRVPAAPPRRYGGLQSRGRTAELEAVPAPAAGAALVGDADR